MSNGYFEAGLADAISNMPADEFIAFTDAYIALDQLFDDTDEDEE